VHSVAAAMFLIGAVVLFREGRSHHQSSGEEFVAKARDVHGLRQVLACFLVIFAAEWGDLSQLLTINLVLRFEEPVEVFTGALGALLTISALAVLVGRQLLRWIPLHVLHYVGAGVCLVLGLVTVADLVA
jgi:Ca2+/H+ antiporter, TMEM165/GDT1 family